MFYFIDEIEGIGLIYVVKFGEVGIKIMEVYFECVKDLKGCKVFEEEMGIDGKWILKWVNMVDLMCISGVGEEYFELFEVVGVDMVKEFKYCNVVNLVVKMKEVNEEKSFVC